MGNEITMDMVKELRDLTGISIGVCKKALVEANGDMEKAITNLRKAGVASAIKKEGRTTNEGMIGTAESDKAVAIVEVNAETDFVVRNDKFQEFLQQICQQAVNSNVSSLDALLQQKCAKDPNLSLDEYRATMIQTIGENIQVRRVHCFSKTADRSVGIYSHLGGKLVVVVELSGANGQEALAKDIAMHIAASSPEYISPEKVPAEVINHEKEIIRSQIKDKPENMIEKITEGKLNAYFKENCLTLQPFIKDDSMTVGALVSARGKELNKPLTIANFTRWIVGQ